MKPVRPTGEVTDFSKPTDWDDRNGTCLHLPIRREVIGTDGSRPYLAHFSNWKPDSDELARLSAGHVVELCCCSIQPAVSVDVVPCGDPDAAPPARTAEAIRGAVARGWCHEPNTEKEMDSDLAEAISREVAALFGCPFDA